MCQVSTSNREFSPLLGILAHTEHVPLAARDLYRNAEADFQNDHRYCRERLPETQGRGRERHAGKIMR